MESRHAVFVQKSWTGKYFTIRSIGTMDAETHRLLGCSHLTEKQMKEGEKEFGHTYTEKMRVYPNDVSISHYDPKIKEAYFTASTEKDVENWLKLYADKVVRVIA